MEKRNFWYTVKHFIISLSLSIVIIQAQLYTPTHFYGPRNRYQSLRQWQEISTTKIPSPAMSAPSHTIASRNDGSKLNVKDQSLMTKLQKWMTHKINYRPKQPPSVPKVQYNGPALTFYPSPMTYQDNDVASSRINNVYATSTLSVSTKTKDDENKEQKINYNSFAPPLRINWNEKETGSGSGIKSSFLPTSIMYTNSTKNQEPKRRHVRKDTGWDTTSAIKINLLKLANNFCSYLVFGRKFLCKY